FDAEGYAVTDCLTLAESRLASLRLERPYSMFASQGVWKERDLMVGQTGSARVDVGSMRRGLAKGSGRIVIPGNVIPVDCTVIAPSMLTLVDLEAEHIERIVCSIAGGSANIQDIYPLAPLQEGVLFHHLLDGQNDDYAVACVLEFESGHWLNRFI